ncbi:MAG: DUF1343 domain-containing protein [Deltaproteobacteria bacterium]|nr:DUF1343 domain-containing protein [Deltaproteobacteria bacterium]
MPRVQPGLERLADEFLPWVRDRRVGLVSHPASVTTGLVHAREYLVGLGAKVCALFGPEHGLGGEAQDMETVDASGSEATVRVHSLYGDSFASLSPRREWLEGLDVAVIDLQDVGSRYYTFVWTAVLFARACAEAGLAVLVCDRPNPLGGLVTEGSLQLWSERSFVGLVPTPIRHGLTLAELVRWVAYREGLDNVTVVPMRGWKREMHFEDTGLPWVLPSPNMPTVDTAFVYPGGCLLEGTNLSEGRGTTRPFELVGAPYLPPQALSQALDRHGGGGCVGRPVTFRPMFQKHQGVTCQGVQVHVTDRARFSPVRAYLSMIHEARRHEGFRWRTEPYEFVADRPALDLLLGDPSARLCLETGGSVDDVLNIGRQSLVAWDQLARERWFY